MVAIEACRWQSVSDTESEFLYYPPACRSALQTQRTELVFSPGSLLDCIRHHQPGLRRELVIVVTSTTARFVLTLLDKGLLVNVQQWLEVTAGKGDAATSPDEA